MAHFEVKFEVKFVDIKVCKITTHDLSASDFASISCVKKKKETKTKDGNAKETGATGKTGKTIERWKKGKNIVPDKVLRLEFMSLH